MLQEELGRPVKNLGESLRNHINLRINYAGLTIGKSIAEYTSSLINVLILAGIFAMIILMLSFAFVFWYASAIGPYHHGFLIISLFYMLLGLIIYLNRNKFLLDPLVRKMYKRSFTTDVELEKRLGPIKGLNDLVHYEEIMKLQLEHSELVIQQRMEQMSEAYAPRQLFKTVMASALTSTNLIAKIVTIVLKVISDRKEQKAQEEQSED